MRTSLAIVVLLLAASPALAHRLHVEPRLAGDVVRVEAFYDDGTPAEDAKITLTVATSWWPRGGLTTRASGPGCGRSRGRTRSGPRVSATRRRRRWRSRKLPGL